MNRRDLLRGMLGVGAGLVLPPSVAENVEATRRYWALDRTMARPAYVRVMNHDFCPWVEVRISEYEESWRGRAMTWRADQLALVHAAAVINEAAMREFGADRLIWSGQTILLPPALKRMTR